MRKLLIPSLLLVATYTYAACIGSPNCTVKAAGGGNYTTVQACATAMANGDTCTVFAGTYNEHVTLTAGGVASYKTLTVNPGDTVNVFDFSIDSHDKLNGFKITNPSSPNSSECVTVAVNATDFYITNNIITACGVHGLIFERPTTNAVSHGFIQGNTLSYPCSTSGAPNVCTAMFISGSTQLIENNDISHTSDGIYLFGNHTMIRNNTFHDNTSGDCGTNSANCHIDFVQSEPNPSTGDQPTQDIIIENNTELRNTGPDGHGFLMQADVCGGQCFHTVIRFNTVAHLGSGGILDDNAGTTPSGGNTPAFINVKAYNNTWADLNASNNGSGAGTNSHDHGSYGGSEVNEIFYYPEALTNFNPYECQDSNNGTSSPACTGPPTLAARNNLAFCTTDGVNLAGTCQLRSHVYGVGVWTDDTGNIVSNPLFVSYAGDNFHLTSGSPARNAGTNLTTVNGTIASSTALVVTDATYFQDGLGVTGVLADCISVTTVGNHVCITAVNYTTNTLTLASPISATNGDSVWIYSISDGTQVLTGTAPDMGSLPFSNATASPTPAPALGMFAELK